MFFPDLLFEERLDWQWNTDAEASNRNEIPQRPIPKRELYFDDPARSARSCRPTCLPPVQGGYNPIINSHTAGRAVTIFHQAVEITERACPLSPRSGTTLQGKGFTGVLSLPQVGEFETATQAPPPTQRRSAPDKAPSSSKGSWGSCAPTSLSLAHQTSSHID